MPPSRRKGVLILSVGRSGTNWLKSISDATGRMGHTGEWLGFEKLEKPWQADSAQSYYDHIIQRASTPNARFSIKIFPRNRGRGTARIKRPNPAGGPRPAAIYL